MDYHCVYRPCSKVLGGPSSINGMCYVRTHARNNDRAAQSGLSGLDYAYVLHYFRMGPANDGTAVVDGAGQVYGLAGL